MATVTALLDLRIKPESVAKAKETAESVLVATRAFSMPARSTPS